MDLFKAGPSGPVQIHDFNPGTDNGLFWTKHIPLSAVRVDLGAATATLTVDDLDVEDYGNLANALRDGPSSPASVSYTMRWSGVKARVDVTDFETSTNPPDNHRFAGRFIEGTAVIERFTATVFDASANTIFSFVADPSRATMSKFAEIGRERNGVFFREEQPD